MKHLEDELKKAMRREEPPHGFTERVLAATSKAKPAPWDRLFAWPGLRWVLAGAMCLALMAAGLEYRQEQVEKARGEAAKAELMQALRITAYKLEFAQAKVQKFTSGLRYLN